MLAKLPDTNYLGCDLYIDVEEEYKGHAEEFAEICAKALSDLHKQLQNSVPMEFIKR